MSGSDSSAAGRLDQYVARKIAGVSRSSATKLIEEGRVGVNGEIRRKASYKVKPGDDIEIDYDETSHAKIPDIKLTVLYEDDDCVVISKPVGLLTHSKGAFNPEPTVASWLSGRVKGIEGDRAGIVHRLDRATSGVMICAKTPEALAWLQKQFSQRKTRKSYIAIVEGVLKRPEAVIDMPIERNPKHPQTFRVGGNGKTAQTAYEVIESDGERSLLELRPVTGRTHQLRVHLAELGHPIIGDTLYGGRPASRLFLHAQTLEITLPSKERATFKVPLPPEFPELLRS